jgi:hypothetical protein
VLNVLTCYGSRKLEIETKCLQDELVTLKLAIEKAIMKGQRSVANAGEVPEHTLISGEYSMHTHAAARPGVVGWVDDL